MRVGAIAMAFAAWTLLPWPTAQTQRSALGWNSHQPSDAHEFETEKAKKKNHTHTYTYTQKKKGVSSPLATRASRGGAPEGGRRPPRGSTRGALAAREPRVPASSDPGLLPGLHRPARTLGTRVTGSHRGGARVRAPLRGAGPQHWAAGCPGVGVCGGGNDTRTEGSRGFTL